MYSWESSWVDYYEILGLTGASSLKDIRSNHRKLVKELHPDANKSDPEPKKKAKTKRFILVQNAYHALTDHTQKLAYDKEWNRRNPAKKATSSGTSGAKTSGTKPGSSRSTGYRSTPPPPPRPKIYKPVIGVDPDSITVGGEEGHPIKFSFAVHHLSGDLPPNWTLGVEVDEVWLDKANFSMNPINSFPTRITANLPPQPAGDFYGSIKVQIRE